MSGTGVVVLDASVVLSFVFPDDQWHQQATSLLQEIVIQNREICAPAMLAYECDSVIRLRVWKGQINEEQAQIARAVISALPIARHTFSPATLAPRRGAPYGRIVGGDTRFRHPVVAGHVPAMSSVGTPPTRTARVFCPAWE